MKAMGIIEKIIPHYGWRHQMMKCMEECAELIQAISKYLDDPHDETRTHVVEEIADVEFMLEQLKHQYILDVTPKEITDVKAVKMYKVMTEMVDGESNVRDCRGG